MKLPCRTSFGAHTINIRTVTDSLDAHVYGTWDEPELRITICEGPADSMKFEALIHEYVEAVNSLLELQLDHAKIQALGLGLAQLLARQEYEEEPAD